MAEIRSPALEEGSSRIARLPDLKDIVDLSPSDQLLILERFQILDPIDKAKIDEINKAQRLHRLNKELANAELANIIDKSTKKELRRLTKETMRSWTIAQTVSGDSKQQYIWIGEGDLKQCDNCAEQEGEIATYQEFVANGTLPGPTTCLGGEDCRCFLARVS